MTNAVMIFILLVIGVLALNGTKKRLKGGCCGGGKSVKIKPSKLDYKYSTTALIDGMTCKHCKVRVENAFNSLAGCSAKVNLKNRCAVIRSVDFLDEEKIAEIIQNAGYTFMYKY